MLVRSVSLLGSSVLAAGALAVPGTAVAPVPCDEASLVAAVSAANAHPGSSIDLTEGCTYQLTEALPAISAATTVNGHHATLARTQTAAPFRILRTDAAGVSILDLSVTGGHTAPGEDGGGILNTGALVLTRVTIRGNSTGDGPPATDGGAGGGVFSSGGTLSIADSTVTGNVTGSGGPWARVGTGGFAGSGGNGGGIGVRQGTLTVERSSVGGNRTGNGGDSSAAPGAEGDSWAHGGYGGGIWSTQRTTGTDSAVCDNTAGDGGTGGPVGSSPSGSAGHGGPGGNGGGAYVAGTATFTHSMLCRNSSGGAGTGGSGTARGYDGNAGDGGGLWTGSGTATLADTTITDNRTGSPGTVRPGTPGSGGGIYDHTGDLTVTGGRLARNRSGRDGGGVGLHSTRKQPVAHFRITGAKITGNLAGGNGGGIAVSSVHDTAAHVLADSVVTGNTAARGGGIHLGSGNTVQLDHDTIGGNRPDDCVPPGCGGSR
ncbi:hypothetical protein [Amycolatopsis dendrobii]|uniref:Polymorphic outer membrane protein repeat-containing protein n=1 Tax=Amycolatopsis dendrobii TaxID=2760662 RepID=A0A7W3ZES9_9PSEU|nr:hypothetical protein [Amycolatopsis dendrobii]MBB1158367.1 hypothetical protein [Amycolatopsis dendrobii]